MKKVQRTLAAVLAAMMLMALAGCSKGDVTKEVNSGLSDLKAQAAEPAVEPQTETPAEPKTCTCDPAPAEGEAHKEGCPLYVAPEKPAVPSHIDTCSDDCTDADCKCPCHLFDKIMACATQEALEDLIAETPEEYFGLLSDEQIQKVEAHIKSLETVPLPAVTIENDVAEETVPSEIVRPTVNYTYVAPFGDPVTGGDN